MRRVRRLPHAFGSVSAGAQETPPGRTLLNGMKVAFDQRVALTPVQVDFVERAPGARSKGPRIVGRGGN